jgi:hypothetical protein
MFLNAHLSGTRWLGPAIVIPAMLGWHEKARVALMALEPAL